MGPKALITAPTESPHPRPGPPGAAESPALLAGSPDKIEFIRENSYFYRSEKCSDPASLHFYCKDLTVRGFTENA